MAKSPKNVHEFLTDLAARLKPQAEKDLKTLIALKAEDVGSDADVADSRRFFHWDFPFYNQRLLEEKYKINQEESKLQNFHIVIRV